MNKQKCPDWFKAVIFTACISVSAMSGWAEGVSPANGSEAKVAGNSDGFYQKYPHLDDFFPYFPYAGSTDERMLEICNKSYFNIICDYNFFYNIAEIRSTGTGKWEEKSLGITPSGQAYFDVFREHRLKIFGHVQTWMGRLTLLNPLYPLSEHFGGVEREPTEQEYADAEKKLRKNLEWFGELSREHLKDILAMWVTDDEPNNVGLTRAMHRMMSKYAPSKPVFNVNPWMGSAVKMVPHVEIQGCDFYVHTDSFRHQWDMQDKFEKLYRLNPSAITMFVGDTTSFFEPTKSFLRDARPEPAELRNLVWQTMAGGAKGVGYWNFATPYRVWNSVRSVVDYYYRPQAMNVLATVGELGQRLTATGPLFLHTHPELDGKPDINTATCNYSTYTGPMIKSGVLKHNTSGERLVVLVNQNLDGAASGTVTAPPSWNGKQVFDLDRLVEVKADVSGTGRYPVNIAAAGDAAVWLVGTAADFARSREVILRHRAEMELPLVENQLRFARRWKLDVSAVENILKQAEAQAKAGQYAPCAESRETALRKAQEVIRADKDIVWLRERLDIVAGQLSGISLKVSGNWRPLGMLPGGGDSNANLDLPLTSKIFGGEARKLKELSEEYSALELMVRTGQREKLAELQSRLPMLSEAAKVLDQKIDRIVAEQLASMRKPVRVAYLTAGRECMDFVLTYSWLFDACTADWVTLGDDGVLRNREKKPVKLSDYDVLWMHQVNSCRPTKGVKDVKLEDVLYPAYLKPEFKEAVKAHAAAGKGLLLTGLSTCYTVALGRETDMPDMYHDGGVYQGSFDAGYKPVSGTAGHPVFSGLDGKGFYASSNTSPYNEVSECTWRLRRPAGRVVASLLDPDIGDIQDYATLVEYGPAAAGNGLIMALGGIAMDATPGGLTALKNPRMIENQRQLLLNALEYLAQGKPYAFTVSANTATMRQLTMLPSVWRFKLDPKDEGLAAKWYDPGLNESAWKDIPVGTSWESCGYDYDGYAWYRVRFKAPPECKGKKVNLHFGAVDELAVVFLDGREIGRQNLVDNWDKPFEFDITSALGDCSSEHQLTVRVHDSSGAGGIWRKVWLEAADK